MNAEEVAKNNMLFEERRKKYMEYGYNTEKERLYIIESGEPFSGRILEAGTGKGHLTIELAKKGLNFVSYDVDKEIQYYAKLNLDYFNLSEKVELVIEKDDVLSFPDKSFDVIFCVNTLHHIEHPEIVLNEFLRILSLEGKIVLSDFTQKTFEIMDRVHKSEGGIHEVIGWSMDDAAKHFNNKGYEVKEIFNDFQKVFIITK